jgi:ATP-dependent DNA ligase
MSLELKSPYPPMEALSVEQIPEGSNWQYEPKWDGFRCLIFREGNKVTLQSKACRPLTRYFPELVRAVLGLKARRFVLDGEIAVPVGDVFSFDDLLLRLHPAESRILKLSESHPAIFIAFDFLADQRGKSIVSKVLAERRHFLEKFAGNEFANHSTFFLSPSTQDVLIARNWFDQIGEALDGIIAKRLDFEYRSGERTGMQKIKKLRTVDCVIGGFRYAEGGKGIGSILLGLYDKDGLLHHVGFTSSFKRSNQDNLINKLKKFERGTGFTGRAPGGPSRWNSEKTGEWIPLKPKLVVEVTYDHFTGGRFRHGTKIHRFRPDKDPTQCSLNQIQQVTTGLAFLKSKQTKLRSR